MKRFPALLLIAALGTASCSGSDPDTNDGASVEGAVVTTAVDGTSDVSTAEGESPQQAMPEKVEPGTIDFFPNGPLVRLIDAGAEPFEPLRIEVDNGTWASNLRVASSFVQTLDGAPLDFNLPVSPVDIDLTMNADGLDADELYTGVFSFDRFDSQDPAAPPEVTAAYGNMVGLGGETQIQRNGTVLSARLMVPETEIDQVTSDLFVELGVRAHDAFSMPLPTEPVGVGATWQATLPLATNGIVVDTLYTYVLSSFDGNRFVIDVSAAQEAIGQEIDTPVFNGSLAQSTVSGTGTIEGASDRLGPVNSTMTYTGSQVLRSGDSEMRQDISIDSNMSDR